jgi:nucleotide-binding universal stress UspA family protein
MDFSLTQKKRERKRKNVKTEINTILLATDFLQSSRLALDYAVVLANKLGAQLMIVNAFELGPEADTVEKLDHIPSRTRRDAEARLQAFVAGSNCAGVPANWALVEGSVPNAILHAVDQHNADLLVLGTQGVHRGLGHLLIGSNTEALMLRSTCPTLTIGPHVLAGVDLNSHFKKVVYVSNFRPASAAAAPFALKLSQSLSTDIEIYQVARDVEQEDKKAHLKEMAEEYCSRLRSVAQGVSEEWCSTEYQMGRVISPETVLEKSMDPSVLMVLGAHHLPLLERHLQTSYPYRLLATAACPIVTVRS